VNLCRSPNLATKDPDHSSQMLLSSSVAEIVQLDNIPVSLGFETGPIKFYLRVRATYLDTIFQVLNEASASEYAKSAKSFDTLKKHWILHFFCPNRGTFDDQEYSSPNVSFSNSHY
jgi:hypothetical protein